jgi:hypothetical protein
VHPDIESVDAIHTLCIESQRAWRVGDCGKRSGERIALRKLRGLVAGETPVNAEVHLAFRTDCKSKRAVVSRMFISLQCRTLST